LNTRILRFLFPVIGLLLGSSCGHTVDAAADQSLDRNAMDQLITSLVEHHEFERSELEATLSQARYLQSVIDAITRPAEKLAWHRYKRIFLTEDRINEGLEYWQRHRDSLAEAEQRFGVPAEIIVAIIGIETRYGSHTGRYRVIDSLATLAFHYPRRADFFRSELEEFLLLTREQQVDPLEITGSYAGAMGIPQFISSSYRNYAVDFDGDHYVDLWNNHADAIGSVANYFREHGWEEGEPVIYPVEELPADARRLVRDDPSPAVSYDSLQQAGVKIRQDLALNTRVALMEFEETSGPVHWLGLKNFYVITRYNHSRLYALAAYLLSREIRERYETETAGLDS